MVLRFGTAHNEKSAKVQSLQKRTFQSAPLATLREKPNLCERRGDAWYRFHHRPVQLWLSRQRHGSL